MNLIDLPDLCLMAIIKGLPIQDILRIGVLCQRMYTIQQSIVPILCQAKTSIRIDNINKWSYYSTGDVDFFQTDTEHHLNVRWQNERKYESNIIPVTFTKQDDDSELKESQMVKYDFAINSQTLVHLSKLFPNILQLTLVNLDRVFEACQFDIGLILSCWPNLESLKFFGYYDMHILIENLNRLHSLKYLNVEMEVQDLAGLTILPHLKELNCRFGLSEDNLDEDISHIMNQLIKANQNIDTIGLMMDLWGDFETFELHFSPQLIAKLRHLVVKLPITIAGLDIICDNWHAITYLDIQLLLVEPNLDGSNQLAIVYVLKKLSQFPHLTELRCLLNTHQREALQGIEEKEAIIKSLPKFPLLQRVKLEANIGPHQFHLLRTIFSDAKQIILAIRSSYFEVFIGMMCKSCVSCKEIEQILARKSQLGLRTTLLHIKSDQKEVAQLKYLPF